MKEASTSNVVDFLIHEVFYKFGFPEVIHCSAIHVQDLRGSGREFHLKTPIYCPQSNAADGDHRDWDAYIPEIEVVFRNAIHLATGEAPFLTVFGHHMSQNGANYKLARKLKSLCDHGTSDPAESTKESRGSV